MACNNKLIPESENIRVSNEASLRLSPEVNLEVSDESLLISAPARLGINAANELNGITRVEYFFISRGYASNTVYFAGASEETPFNLLWEGPASELIFAGYGNWQVVAKAYAGTQLVNSSLAVIEDPSTGQPKRPVTVAVLGDIGGPRGALSPALYNFVSIRDKARSFDPDGATLVGGTIEDPFTKSGDFIEFTVKTPAAGPGVNNIHFSYTNFTSQNLPLEVRLNGSAIAPTLDFPVTLSPDNSNYTGVSTIQAFLPEGVNTIRITSLNNDGPTVGTLWVAGVPAIAPVVPVPIRYEAENAAFRRANGSLPVVATDIAGFSGSGYVSFTRRSSQGIIFTIEVLENGTYDFVFGYNYPVSINITRPFQFSITTPNSTARQDFNISFRGELSFEPFSGRGIISNVTLKKGVYQANLVAIGNASRNPDIDFLDVSSSVTRIEGPLAQSLESL